ncbi:MAG: BMP family ABC transporter substrate-binding protein [Oscillospiraceae bacterium]|nr:BMP family ABC transporter substrate-binding protein [Oscillospiraceae bacterium]
MKKLLALLLCVLLVASLLVGCNNGTPTETPTPDPTPTPDAGTPATPEPDEPERIYRVAAIMNEVGVNPFLTQVVDELAAIYAEGIFPMEYRIMEFTDVAMAGEHVRAAVEEGFDLIINVGFQAADAMAEVSQMFPDRATYVNLDIAVDSPYVKSVLFTTSESAYLIGIIAAMVAEDMGHPMGPFGQVGANPGQGSFHWRYGFIRGVQSVNPDVDANNDFIFNFTRSFSDAPLAKELALQQAAQGAVFINAASAVADFGTFEAALEAGFFTSGQDADRTTPDNPNILSTQTKYTGRATRMVIEQFFNGGITPGVVRWGIAEGGVGATNITSPGNFRNYEVLTDEIVAAALQAVEDIRAGRIVLYPVPLEETFMEPATD